MSRVLSGGANNAGVTKGKPDLSNELQERMLEILDSDLTTPAKRGQINTLVDPEYGLLRIKEAYEAIKVNKTTTPAVKKAIDDIERLDRLSVRQMSYLKPDALGLHRATSDTHLENARKTRIGRPF